MRAQTCPQSLPPPESECEGWVSEHDGYLRVERGARAGARYNQTETDRQRRTEPRPLLLHVRSMHVAGGLQPPTGEIREEAREEEKGVQNGVRAISLNQEVVATSPAGIRSTSDWKQY